MLKLTLARKGAEIIHETGCIVIVQQAVAQLEDWSCCRIFNN